MRFQPLPGFRDFYPEEMAVRRAIEEAWHRASLRAGFQEWSGPPLESLELFTAKSGDEIVEQLYAFTDRGGRQVALRPEMTPTLARVIAARAAGMPKPIKWYCVEQFFRYERPQRGRLREFYQWNADVVGAAEPACDAELIAVALDGLRLLGLGERDVVVRVNDRRFVRRMLQELEVGEPEEAATLACIDKLERDPASARKLDELLGAARASAVRGLCERPPLDRAPELEQVLEACADYGIRDWVEADFRIVRGLAYYTGPVWEVFDRGRSLRAIAGGGRYDELIAQLGGPPLSAAGFGMGDVVLTELLAEKGLRPAPRRRLEWFVVPVGPELLGVARGIVRRLRDAGHSADAPYAPLRVGKALRAATQVGATHAVLVGPDEWKDRAVRVRDLESGEERLVPLEQLA
jgi:histidyl-tRNA synthetase